MKNKQLSTVCIVSALVAILSAFQPLNEPSRLSPASYAAYYMNPDGLSSSSSLSNTVADQSKFGEPLHTASAPFNVNAYGPCFLDNDHICIAEIAYESDGTTPSSGNVIDFIMGDPPIEVSN